MRKSEEVLIETAPFFLFVFTGSMLANMNSCDLGGSVQKMTTSSKEEKMNALCGIFVDAV